MRRAALVLMLALSSLAFAPAPFPKAERRGPESPEQKQRRELAQCRRRLDELGVKWQLEGGGRTVRFRVSRPDGRATMGGSFGVIGGDLSAALRRLVRSVENFFRNDGPP
jgi:hypothetical protein